MNIFENLNLYENEDNKIKKEYIVHCKYCNSSEIFDEKEYNELKTLLLINNYKLRDFDINTKDLNICTRCAYNILDNIKY